MNTEKIFNYPDEFASRDAKSGEEWGLQYFKAAYAEWEQGGTHLLKSRHKQILRNRQYADAQQSTDLYKNQFNIRKNKSYVNINWEIISVIPKFIDILTGYFSKIGENITATANDAFSVDRFWEDKALQQADIALQEDLLWMDRMTGRKQQEQGFKPRNNEELEIYMDTTYKQEWEVLMEELLDLIWWLNEMDGPVKDDFIRALVVDGMAGLKRELDANGKIKARNVDVLESMIGFSKKRNMSDLQRAGEFLVWTIGDLRAACGDFFSKEEYEQVADHYLGQTDLNPDRRAYYNNSQFGDFPYDNVKIRVLDMEFRTTNRYVWEKKFTKYSVPDNPQYTFTEKPLGWNPPKDSENREKVSRDVSVWMKGMWVVGTDFLFNYGPLSSQVRNPESLAEASSSYYFYRPNAKALCERMIPFADSIQLKTLKMQHTVARARPRGMMINMDAIEEVSDGQGGIMKGLQIREIFDQTGDLLYRSTDVDDPDISRRSVPFTEIENGVGNALKEFEAGINFDIEMIRQVTGISEIMDAMLPQDSRQSATAAKLVAGQTANTLTNIYTGWLSAKERMLSDMSLMIQDLMKEEKLLPAYRQALGNTVFQLSNPTNELSLRDFGIRIQARPSEQEQMILEQEIQNALKQRAVSGQGGLEIEDAFAIREVMKVSIHKAQLLLTLRKKRRRDEDMQLQQQMAEHKAQVDQQSAQSASHSRMQEIQMQTDEAIRLEKAKTDEAIRLAREQGEIKLKEIAEQGNQKKQQVIEKNNAPKPVANK